MGTERYPNNIVTVTLDFSKQEEHTTNTDLICNRQNNTGICKLPLGHKSKHDFRSAGNKIDAVRRSAGNKIDAVRRKK